MRALKGLLVFGFFSFCFLFFLSFLFLTKKSYRYSIPSIIEITYKPPIFLTMSILYHHFAMHSPTTTSTTATQNNELIDERFDLFIDSHPRDGNITLKDRRAMTSSVANATTNSSSFVAYNNHNEIKNTYNNNNNNNNFYPLVVDKEKIGGGADTACFKEDLGDYFPAIRIQPATPLPTTVPHDSTTPKEESDNDYFNNATDNNNSIDEVIQIESVTVSASKKESTSTASRSWDDIYTHGCAPPRNLEEYHSGLVEHYLDRLLSITSATDTVDSIHATLPQVYKDYLESIHQYCM
ncbi:hypothetical protein BDF20DRAFT_998620 [Mycotypha africana]|uniref:uncharacterized protein n=1 Tax=Mycotypha africana TaxID=64632 RepID=UPI0023005E42|nr:uncharacterized protein BDF20DRAFT_998620 [Mycotypha africana]KAI8988107.1 hypothetical protein BDF20DRAFT_998620 [Mycotypha africana]